MASKPTLPTLVNTGNVQAQLTTINNGYRQIENEFEKMLSREDNSLPNHMLDALDMDGHKVINVEDGTEGADAVNKSQLDTKEDLLGSPPASGMVLASTAAGDRYWTSDLSVLSATLTVAPQDARYVVVTSNPLLTNESVLTVGSNLTITDNTSSIQIDALVDPIDHLDFDTTPVATGAVGRLVWNDADGTLDLGVKGGNVTLQVGQEQHIRVVNKTGGNLLEANYQAVKISGAQGQRPKVGLAQADTDLNSADTIGLVTETILNNQEGFVTNSGIVRNINTTGSLQGETWADGDVLYLSGITAGAITNIKPQSPIHSVIVGFVIYAHNNQGKIFVKVDNGYEIDELHNVKVTSVADKNVLRYNTSLGVWENIAQTALTAGIANTVDNTNSASNLSFWTGSQAQYNALSPDSNTLYFIT
jgi:hypothetical protein